VARRIHYNNHAPIADSLDDVREKLAKEEAKSYHLALPRSVTFFIDGIFICFMSWVVQKGKGRIVIDPSTHLSDQDTGALNDSIPRPGQGSVEESPPITFAHAFTRHLTHLWNLWISHPTQELLQHVDDIEAAFHRIPYHPDLGICFAYVFCEFLIVPIGTIFGAGDSPGWFGLTAECRTHLAAVRDYSHHQEPLAELVQISPPPTTEEISTFVPAMADAIHRGIPPEFASRHLHAMFVDDNATVAIRERIKLSINSAVGSAYDNYGHPQFD
jgi:hypothetical protein